PGTYLGSIAIAAPGSPPQAVTITLTVTAAAPAGPTIAAVVNAASLVPGSVAPGQIITIYGSGLGPAPPAQMQGNAGGLVDNTLAGARVLFDGVAGSVIYASNALVSAVVPYGIAGRFSTRIQVEFLGARSSTVDQIVTDTAPGIFTMSQSGRGQGAIL